MILKKTISRSRLGSRQQFPRGDLQQHPGGCGKRCCDIIQAAEKYCMKLDKGKIIITGNVYEIV
jgi:hypothetical protein